jgi:membrane-bound serine protease (ClpP class)
VFESRADKFLTVNGTRAVELGLANEMVDNLDDVRERFGWTGNLLVLKPNVVDTTVFILNLPLVTFVLLIVGLVALYVEASAPGISIGGLIALLCFALFFWSRFLGGTSGWLEVVLFVSGVMFVLAEIYLIPGFGVAGVSGFLLMVAGMLLASQDFVIPNSTRQVGTLLTTGAVLAGSAIVFVVIAITLTRYLGDIPILNRLALKPPSADQETVAFDRDKNAPAETKDYVVAVGDWGVAESTLRPAGKAAFGDQYLDVVADGSFIDKGQQVRVIEISGNRVVVRRVDNST